MIKLKNVEIVPEILIKINNIDTGDYLTLTCELVKECSIYIKLHIINKNLFEFEVRKDNYYKGDNDDLAYEDLGGFITLVEARQFAEDYLTDIAIRKISKEKWFRYEGKDK